MLQRGRKRGDQRVYILVLATESPVEEGTLSKQKIRFPNQYGWAIVRLQRHHDTYIKQTYKHNPLFKPPDGISANRRPHQGCR